MARIRVAAAAPLPRAGGGGVTRRHAAPGRATKFATRTPLAIEKERERERAAKRRREKKERCYLAI